MTKAQYSDEELWSNIVMDDTRSFVVLYNRYWRKLYKTANYYLKDGEAAEQILQDVFVVLWKRRKHLKIANFNNYIFIAARYHVFSHLKALKISPIEYIEEYTDETALIGYNDAEEKFGHADFKAQLEECLQYLPKRCREIFWLSRIENLSNEEIADQLSISKRTVENQITHALKHLRLSKEHFSTITLGLIFIELFS